MARRLLLIVNTFLLILITSIDGDARKPNILFLVSDDMRPNIGAYEGPDFPSPVHPKMVTPNLDELAGKSLLLKQAYCQVALCSPSRTSLLTGRRPDTTRVIDLYTYFRKSGGNFTTIPQFFKENGYETIGIGKIFHPGKNASNFDDPISWTRPYFHAKATYYSYNYSWRTISKKLVSEKGPLRDQRLMSHALKTLDDLGKESKNPAAKPFFLAVGFHKPHLPFVFPEEYLQFYPKEEIRLPANPHAPIYMPEIAWNNYTFLMKFKDIQKINATGTINSSLPDDVIIDLRRAYYSAITYIDDLVGKILQKLSQVGLSNNTIVSFWGDHGWQLGEHSEWQKQTNFELATHAPMMVHIPGLTDHGIQTQQLTEFVDLFPTLVEAAGFGKLPICPVNSGNIELCTEGSSLIPLIKNPARSDWKSRVFSQFIRNYKSEKPHAHNAMGYTMRTNQYRYTEWVRFQQFPDFKPFWNEILGVELYDHKIDPEENYNRFNASGYADIKMELSNLLHQGFRTAMPRF